MSKNTQNQKKCGKRTNSVEEIKPKKKRKNVSNHEENSIAKSRQLSIKLKSKSEATRKSVRNKRSNAPSTVSCNGKPMPSLAELEKMYEDSEEEERPTCINTESMNKEAIPPGSVKKAVSRLLETLSNISDPNELINILPLPPNIPPKKTKNTGKPYIVGCKDRTQVIRKPKTNWAQGHDDYGVLVNVTRTKDNLTEADMQEKGLNQRSYSKSHFNNHGDEIDKTSLDNECLSNCSTDSNKTISYYDDSVNETFSPNNRSFSPLPSTSKDNNTFLENDQRLKECLGNVDNDSDVEIIENPFETIVVCSAENNSASIKNNQQHDDYDVHFVNEEHRVNHTTNNDILVPSIDNDNLVSTVQINDTNGDLEVEEVNVDDVIAENSIILEKYYPASKPEITVVVGGPDQLIDSIRTPETTMNEGCENDKNIERRTSVIVTNNDASAQENLTNTPTENTPSSASNIFIDTSTETIIGINNQSIENISTESQIQPQTSSLDTVVEIDLVTIDVGTNTERALIERSSEHNDSDVICVDTYSIDRAEEYECIFVYEIPAPRPLATSHAHPPPSTQPSFSRRQQKANTKTSTALALTNNENRLSSKTTSMVSQKGASGFGDCPICMDTLGAKPIASTMCGHVFCLICIKTSITCNGKTCPTCRKMLKGAGYHPLFI